MHILGIVGQNGQKCVKLGKIAVFMLHHMTLQLEYYEIASKIWYWVRDEMLLKYELHVFGIVGQKDQKWVKLVKTFHIQIVSVSDLKMIKIVPTWSLFSKNMSNNF